MTDADRKMAVEWIDSIPKEEMAHMGGITGLMVAFLAGLEKGRADERERIATALIESAKSQDELGRAVYLDIAQAIRSGEGEGK